MAERIAYLEAIVGADITQFRKGMRDIRNEVGFLSESMRGVSAIGRTMTFTLTAPLVTLATYAGQAAASFDASMRNINSIAQLGEEQFQALSDQVFEFASTTRAGVVPATDALYEIFSAGITDTARAMAVWETSTRVAEAGLASLDKTTNAVTATMSAYGYETEQATRVGDVWTHMVALGVGSLEDFLANSQKVLPLSNALGISFEDVGASIAYVSQQGGGAKKAMTAIAMLESNLLKPTEALTRAYATLGVSTGQELIAKFGSLSEAIIAIKGVAGDDVDFAKMFSKTGLEAAYAFTNNTDKARAAIENFKATVEGATGRAWEEQMKSFAAQFDLFKTSVEAAAIAVGEVLLPMITPIVQKATEWFLAFSRLNPQIVELGVVIAGVVAAAGPLIWILGSLLSPIGLLIGGVAGLAYVVSTNFAAIETAIKGAITGILGADGVGKLESLWATVENILFPPESAPAVIGDIVVPVFARASDFVTIEEGDTLWDIFQDRYAGQMTWEDFRDNVILPNGRTPATLQIGDLIEVPTNLGDQLGSLIAQGLRHSATGTDVPLVALTGGGVDTLQPFANRESPIVKGILDRVREAAQTVATQIGPILEPIMQSVSDWAETKIGEGLSALATLFEPSSEGGSSPLYLAVSALLDGDITRAINAIVPGLGAKIAEQVQVWAKDLSNETGTIQEGAKNLLTSLGTWLEVEGVPTVARSIGYFAGRLALTLNEALSQIFATLFNIQQGNDTNARATGEFIGDSILTPMAEGWGDAMSGAGVDNIADMFFTGLESVLLTGALAWSLAPGVVKAIIGGVMRGLLTGTFLAVDAIAFLRRIGGTLATNVAGTAIWQTIATSIGTRILSAQIFISGVASTFIGAIGTAISTAAAAVSATTSWAVAAGTSIANGVGAAMTTGLTAFRAAIMAIAPSMWAALGPIMLVAGAILAVKLQLDAFKTSIDEAAAQGAAAGSALRTGGFEASTETEFNDKAWAEFVKQNGDNLYTRYLWGTATFQAALAEARNSYFAIGADTATGFTDGVNQNAATATGSVDTMMTGAISTAATTLESSSPSKVFQRLGEDVVAGMILGIVTKEGELNAVFQKNFGPKGTIIGTMTIFKTEFAKVVGAISAEIGKITSAANDAAAAMAAIGVDGSNVQVDGQPRAAGGAANAGSPYWVGDGVGRELFVPDVNGQIVPEHKLQGSGAQPVNQHNEIHIHGVQDVDALLYELKRRGVVLKK